MRIVITGSSGRLAVCCQGTVYPSHAVSSLETVKPRECLCPTYSADLTKSESMRDHFHDVDAVVHLARIRFPYTENGFNAGTQKWEFSDIAGDARRLNQNVAMANNVLAAAQAAGVKKIVCGLSLAIYGFYYDDGNGAGLFADG